MMTNEELGRRIDAIFARQAADGTEKKNSPMYPGSVGDDVLGAVVAARGAVGHIGSSEDAHAFLSAAVLRVAEAHEQWRSNEVDEDGYGSATFHEIRRDLDALLRELERGVAAHGSNPYTPPSGSDEAAAEGGPEATQVPRPANAAWASILSLLALGAGHVYVGRAKRGLAYFGASAAAAVGWGALIRPSYLALGLFGILLTAIVPLTVYVHAAYDAGKHAHARAQAVPIWLVLLAFVGFSVARSPLAVGLRAFFVEAFRIPSASIAPTLVTGDHIFTDKLTPHFRSPHRGELIVFPFPEHPDQNFTKRVVALPGDTVEVTAGNELTINSWQVPRCKVGRMQYRDEMVQHDGDVWMEFLGDSSYLVFIDSGSRAGSGKWHVPQGEVWVMGDNRNNSHDSRMWYGGRGAGVPLGTVRAFPLTVWLSVNEEGELVGRVGADLTGRKLLAPDGLEDAVAKCRESRPKGDLGPPTQPLDQPPSQP
jgi:signal peptidase I